ncbi:MAG TPA: hypothetical protein VF062_27845 [Candidatus Limnocylindrales bacterium]
MITSTHVAAFADALEQSVADELSGRGYSTLCLGPLPLQRIVCGSGSVTTSSSRFWEIS